MFGLTDGPGWISHGFSLILWMVEEYLSVREREIVHMKEEEEKSPKNHHSMARIQTHDPSLLSQVLYPLDHGALLKFKAS